MDTGAGYEGAAAGGVSGGSAARGVCAAFLRLGGATHLSAGGAAPEVLKREGPWASGAYTGHVRNHGRDAHWVSGVMVEGSKSFKKQPGQGTKWGEA